MKQPALADRAQVRPQRIIGLDGHGV